MKDILLQLFLLTSPIHLYQLWMLSRYYHGPHPRNRYVVGVLAGTSGVLTMLFPVALISSGAYQGSLRNCVLILAFQFGGIAGGLLCFAIVAGFRFLMGGEAMWYGISTFVILMLTLVPIGNRFHSCRQQTKYLVTSMYALFASVLPVLSFYLYAHDHHESVTANPGTVYIGLAAVCVSQVICCIVITWWAEHMTLSYKVQSEIHRAEKLQVVSDLAASIAHEIRNPLQIVRGYIQMSQKKTEGTVRTYLDHSLNQLKQAEAIINEYLSYAKPQEDALTTVNIGLSVSQAVQIMQTYARMNGSFIECGDVPNVHITVDETKFKQVIINILKNAIEANRTDGHVRIHIEENNGFVHITISDNGHGLSEEQVRKLGTPYYSTKTNGTGLGLMVTFRLVESMGGKLSYVSKVGAGTNAVVAIPSL